MMNNIAPIFLIILIGFVIGRRFDIEIRSLTKINIYVFVPAIILVKVYETRIERELLGVILFSLILMAIMSVLCLIVAALRRSESSLANAMKNSVLFFNSGNLGLPLIMLLFHDMPYAVSIQIMVLLVNNLTTYTIGLYNANRGKMSIFASLRMVSKMPSVYAVIAVFVLKALPFDFTQSFVWPAAVFIQNGLVPVALITLGIQLSQSTLNLKQIDVYIATFLRLIAGPLAAYGLILIMGYEGIIAQVLLISSSVPTAVNTALIAVEFHNEPDFASQVVLTTTLLSAVTMTGVIYLAQLIF